MGMPRRDLDLQVQYNQAHLGLLLGLHTAFHTLSPSDATLPLLDYKGVILSVIKSPKSKGIFYSTRKILTFNTSLPNFKKKEEEKVH